jgi:hypothetical protein
MVIKDPNPEQWKEAMCDVAENDCGERVVELEAVRAWAHSFWLETTDDPDEPTYSAIRFNYNESDAATEYGGIYFLIENGHCEWDGKMPHGDQTPFRLMLWELLHPDVFGDFRMLTPMWKARADKERDLAERRLATQRQQRRVNYALRIKEQSRRFTLLNIGGFLTAGAIGLLGWVGFDSAWPFIVAGSMQVTLLLGVFVAIWVEHGHD